MKIQMMVAMVLCSLMVCCEVNASLAEQNIGEMSMKERIALSKAALDSVVEVAPWHERMLSWLPGKRSDDSQAYKIQQLRRMTWALREELLRTRGVKPFFILLRKYEQELKAAAVVIGSGVVAGMTGHALYTRGQGSEKKRVEDEKRRRLIKNKMQHGFTKRAGLLKCFFAKNKAESSSAKQKLVKRTPLLKSLMFSGQDELSSH